jgi:hypothetical protein
MAKKKQATHPTDSLQTNRTESQDLKRFAAIYLPNCRFSAVDRFKTHKRHKKQ